jgi:hypothetical protein
MSDQFWYTGIFQKWLWQGTKHSEEKGKKKVGGSERLPMGQAQGRERLRAANSRNLVSSEYGT